MNFFMQTRGEIKTVTSTRFNEIHSEYVKVTSRNENYKIQFDPMMTDYNTGRYKIKISIVAADMKTNKRIKHLESYINALDLVTIADLIQRKDFKSEKFYGGGIEEQKVICRITSFEMKDECLTISIQKCPGKRNNDNGGYSPTGKPIDSISIYLRGFPLQRTLYRLKNYIENKFLMDFKKQEFAPLENIRQLN